MTGEKCTYLAWSRIAAPHPGIRITDRYDLALDFAGNKDVVLAEVERIASSSPPEPGVWFSVMSFEEVEPAPEPRTMLGKQLMEIRRKIIASGQPLLDWNGLERELKTGRSRDLPWDDG